MATPTGGQPTGGQLTGGQVTHGQPTGEQRFAVVVFDGVSLGIEGQDIHFLHVRSPEPDALPLILTHGWPGSVVEFLDVIGPLTDPRAHGQDPSVAFDLVIPSLPGFAFSSPLTDRGWGTRRTAAAWVELMRRLGYGRYGAAGNDAGSMISPEIGRLDPADQRRPVLVHQHGRFLDPLLPRGREGAAYA